MTVVVGYLAGKGGRSPLHLGVEAATTLKTSLTVVTVVPKPWRRRPWPASTPNMPSTQTNWRRLGQRRRRQCIESTRRQGLEVSFHKVRAPVGVRRAVAGRQKNSSAEVLVLGRRRTASSGQVVVGSTADRLLHSSPVPMAIGPRGYRGSKAARADPDHLPHIRARRKHCTWWNASRRSPSSSSVPMRVVTFAVRGRTMYPPEVGLRAEDSILEQLAAQARETLAQLKTDGVVGNDVDLQVVTGNGWDEALDAADWQDGDLLAIGTSPVGGIARVFLGSRGSKILRHSPVPVLVLPG